MDEQLSPVQLAERVAALAAGLGINTAVIGAYALAAHKFVRATKDIDLATAVSLGELRRLEAATRDAGLFATLRTPDAEDPLGGVLVVWQRVDDEGDPVEPVEVVNFTNPYVPRRTPAIAAIRDAVPVEGSTLRYPRLRDLIALKLDTGARRDQADVVDVLAHNPDADLDEIRATCSTYGFDIIEQLIAESIEIRRQRG